MGHSRTLVIFHILVLGTPREPRSEVAPRVLPLALGTDSPKLHSRDSSKGIKVQSRRLRSGLSCHFRRKGA